MASRADYLARWSELHGGYDPSGSHLVGPWLRVVHAAARPLVALRVPASAVTVAGGLAAWGAALCALAGSDAQGWTYAAVALVVVSGLLDGIDGAVAVLSERTSALGHVVDSVVDRVSDLAYVAALWWAGAPPALCAAGAALALLLEYLRARAAVAGMTEIGAVTVWERPTRVIVTAMFLLGAAIYGPVGDAGLSWWATAGAWVWLALGVVGLVQLSVVVARRLRGLTPPG